MAETENKFCIGKVVMIPNEYTIVINVTNEILSVGDEVCIYEAGKEILDYDTKDVIGTFDFIKAQLKVVETYENYSVCKKFVTEKRGGLMSFGALSPLLEGETVVSAEMLNVNPEQNEHLELNNPEICLGDLVKLF